MKNTNEHPNKERPILFSGAMIRAILSGTKTQTRRVIKPQPPDDKYKLCTCISTTGDKRNEGKHHWALLADNGYNVIDGNQPYFSRPYGFSGDRLWVRENYSTSNRIWDDDKAEVFRVQYLTGNTPLIYQADGIPKSDVPIRWRPSIHMPRWASRITLLVKDVHVERVQDITYEGMKAEGCLPLNNVGGEREVLQNKYWKPLWDSINAKRGFGWDTNPYVWCIAFEKVGHWRAS